MAATSFVQRRLLVAVKIPSTPATNQPSTFSNGTNTVTLDGFRISARIQNAGAPGGSSASIDVFGMRPSLMNEMSSLGIVYDIVRRNTIIVQAGDSESGLSTVFSGTVNSAYGNYDSAPDVPFHFECQAGLIDAVAPVPAASFTGATSVSTIMQKIAGQMGVSFENNGVTAQLANPYFPGSLLTQMRACAEHAGINAEVINGQVLAIWPKGGSRKTDNIPLVSKESGMVGYPAYTQQGIIVRTIFRPEIEFGKKIQVQSSLQKATGTWTIKKIDLALDAMKPKGQWMQTVYCYNPEYQQHIIPPR